MKNEEVNNLKTGDNNAHNIKNDNVGVRFNEKRARKEGATKGVLITSIISFILLLSTGVIFYTQYNKEKTTQIALMENQKQSFNEQLITRDSIINEWMLTFDQIEKDLNTVKEKEHIISLKASDREFSKDKKQQILKDIEYINTLLDQNKMKIASLSAQLKKSGTTIVGLQNRVAELEASMKLRENEISELKTTLVEKDFQIGQLNTRMNEQQATIALKDTEINNKTYELNKGFFAYGTYKALKEKGLVYKEGGFLGIGRKESLSENFADSSFSQINISETKTIPVNSKSARLITEHPANSYEMIRGDDNKIAYIEIKDPDQFWKISKYAVVELKN